MVQACDLFCLNVTILIFSTWRQHDAFNLPVTRKGLLDKVFFRIDINQILFSVDLKYIMIRTIMVTYHITQNPLTSEEFADVGTRERIIVYF